MRGFIKRSKIRNKSRFVSLLSTGTICIVLIVSFGVLGVSYASWSQSFSIFGSITTGEINVAIRDVALESSDDHESLSFDANKSGNVVDEVVMEVVTDASPFSSVLVFTVENTGTIPVVCDGIDSSVGGSLEAEVLGTPGKIDVGQTAPIRVKIEKGYCEDFEFSTFLKFVQATG